MRRSQSLENRQCERAEFGLLLLKRRTKLLCVSLELARTFAQWALGRCSDRVRPWLSEELRAAAVPATSNARVAAAFTGAKRRLGSAPVTGEPENWATYPAASGWTLDQLGRVALLTTVDGARALEAMGELVEDLYFRGDGDEKVAVLKALAVLSHPQCYVELGVEACRSNMTSVFEAIACENALPREHFSEQAFNQMVMKALFLGVSVRRIEGVRERLTPELGRMLDDYRAEREAAGRSVPEDLPWLRSLIDAKS